MATRGTQRSTGMILLACSSLLVTGDDRKSGRAASGLFRRSSPLTERMEQATISRKSRGLCAEQSSIFPNSIEHNLMDLVRLGQICWVRLVQKLFSHKVWCSILFNCRTGNRIKCIDWARLRWDLTRAVIASRGRKLIEARKLKTASYQFRLDDDKRINNLFSLHEQFSLHESSGTGFMNSLSISPIARYAMKSNLEMKWALSSTYLSSSLLILVGPMRTTCD